MATARIRPVQRPRSKGGKRKLQAPNPEARAKLLAATDALIREHGFPDLRVEEIARRAGLSVGTFYLYFEGKNDLFTSLVVEHTEALRARCRAAYESDGSVLQRLAWANEAYLDFALENERGFLYFRNSGSIQTTVGSLTVWAFAQHAADLRPVLEEGMRRGEIPPHDPALLTQALLGLMQHLVGVWLEDGKRCSREEFVARLGELGSRLIGLAPASARPRPRRAATRTARARRGSAS